ncbi:hypothetical protein E2C01_007734 [Portunus trituberculatus]|uniref:Chitin-binding type-2 domain-containing protein n=1 Tax=Portunus trituberculatus TaxID=210409 RepID=A0A5B7D4Q9_PORTR|nr:hypothetical protein [Portunus trituberculatus]
MARRPVTASPARPPPATATFRHRVRVGAATPVHPQPVLLTAPRDIPPSPVAPLPPVDTPRQTPFPSSDLPHEPPTVLTAQFPSDSHITVIDEVEATARTDTSARTPDHKSSMATTTTTTTTTTPPSPPFVFPETSFTCIDKIHGGLYADVETGCKVFHICSVEPDKSVKSNKFTCGPGTLFDQKSRTCQVESGIDCAASPTFYYLNERGNLPVFVERAQPTLDQKFPEQQFDFPRIPSSPSSPSLSTLRVRRSADESVDLCASRPLGSPLADITSGCRHYSTCERLADGRLVETRHGCKKDMLFSQRRKRCMLAKKVECVKETLSEILGLGTATPPSGNGRKRRAAALLLSHRFRRAALPSLVNMVDSPKVDDAQVRRALVNLAALQQWSLENAQHSTFIEMYSLQNGNLDPNPPKKTHTNTLSDSEAPKGYEYVLRRKRDLNNIAVEGQVVFVNHTISQVSGSFSTAMPASQKPLEDEETLPEEDETRVTFTGTLALPTIATTTIGQRLRTATAMEGVRHDETQLTGSTTSTSSPPAIPTTLSTLTVSGMPTTATATVVTVTVTTTKTVIPTAINFASAAAALHSTAAVGSNPSDLVSIQANGEAVPGMMATPVLDTNGNGSPESEVSDGQSSKEEEGVTDAPAAFTTLCMIVPPPNRTYNNNNNNNNRTTNDNNNDYNNNRTNNNNDNNNNNRSTTNNNHNRSTNNHNNNHNNNHYRTNNHNNHNIRTNYHDNNSRTNNNNHNRSTTTTINNNNHSSTTSTRGRDFESAISEHTAVELEDTSKELTNWNATKSEAHESETKAEEVFVSVTNQLETTEEATVEPVMPTEVPQIDPEEEITEENDIPSSTTFIPSEEFATETEIVDTELVAEQQEYPGTEMPIEVATTLETVPELASEVEHVTELGPLMRSKDSHETHSAEGKLTNESPVELHVETSLFSTTLSPSIPTEESSTDMSVSTDVSVVSSDFVSSATQVSSDVSVSSSVQPKEDAS